MGIIRKRYGRDINPGGDVTKMVTRPIQVASNVVVELPIGVWPVDMYVKAAYLVNNADIAANDTNYRTFALKDKGTDGNGTTAVSTPKTTQVTGGFAITDYVKYDLLATAGYKLGAGRVLTLDVGDGGTGPVVEGVVVVEFK